MLRHADIILTARVEGLLVGVSRAITDFSYCTYLSDLAVDERFQRRGIGKELIRRTHEAAGLGTTLILLAAPLARGYYPHIGMRPHDSCWLIPGGAPPEHPRPSSPVSPGVRTSHERTSEHCRAWQPRGEEIETMHHPQRMLSGLALIPLLALPAREPAPEALSRSRTFVLTYRATVRQIPEGAKALDLWLPLPQTDRNQTIQPPEGGRPRPPDHRPRASVRQPVPPHPGRGAGGPRRRHPDRRGDPQGKRRGRARPERRGTVALPPGRAAGPPGRPRPAARPGGDQGVDHRRREGTCDLREGRRHDAVRQERDRLGARGRPLRLRCEAGQLHRLPRPGHRHGPLGRHPGPVRHRPAAAGGAGLGRDPRLPLLGRALRRGPGLGAGGRQRGVAGTRRSGTTSSGTTTRTGWSSAGAATCAWSRPSRDRR